MGLTTVDAGVVIGFLDRNDAHHAAAYQALLEAGQRGDRLVLPASALAEVLVGPARRGPEAIAQVRELVQRLPMEIAGLDEETAVAAAVLQARHRSIRLPDALVIATADAVAADRLVTTDRGWPSRSTLGLRAELIEL